MQDQKIETMAAVAVNITKVLTIIFLGLVEVFKIGKSLYMMLDPEFGTSRRWAAQTFSSLKKQHANQKLVGG